MWSQVQKLMTTKPANDAGAPSPMDQKLNALGPGSVITFAAHCPLPQLARSRAIVTQVRTYRFGDDLNISYALEISGDKHYSLTVAEDEQGFYLALARELDPQEQDSWFGRDALSFFTEASTAKTLRCKADLTQEGAWAAARYVKSVDWVQGSVLLGRTGGHQLGRQVKQFHYNLLVNDAGDKALEIEHEDSTGENRIMVTVYRPAEDIASIHEPRPGAEQPPLPLAHASVPPSHEPALSMPQEAPALAAEPALFLAENPMRQRPDFRRMHDDAETIHVAREESKAQPAFDAILDSGMKPLPSFLTARENNYLSLDEVIPPETDRVRCDLRSAKAMIDLAITRNVRVRDIMREMIGLDSALNEEVIFELPLSDGDYRQLAMRYRVRPDHRDEIRRRLQAELSERLIGKK